MGWLKTIFGDGSNFDRYDHSAGRWVTINRNKPSIEVSSEGRAVAQSGGSSKVTNRNNDGLNILMPTPRKGQYDSMLAYFDGIKYGNPINDHYVEAKMPEGYAVKKTNLGYRHGDPNGEGIEYSVFDRDGKRISTSFDRIEFGKRVTWTDVNQKHYQEKYPGNFKTVDDDDQSTCKDGNCRKKKFLGIF